MDEVTIVAIDTADGCKHLRYYQFPIDGSKSFDYNARRSYNAFFSYKATRSRNGNILYVLHNESIGQLERAIEHGVSDKDLFPDAITTRLASLYEFYWMIDYDYKTKKFIHNPFKK